MNVQCQRMSNVTGEICGFAAAVRFAKFNPVETKKQVFTRIDTSTNQQSTSQVSIQNEIKYNAFDVDNLFPNADLCSNDCSGDAEMQSGNARQVQSVVQQ